MDVQTRFFFYQSLLNKVVKGPGSESDVVLLLLLLLSHHDVLANHGIDKIITISVELDGKSRYRLYFLFTKILAYF